MESVVNFLEVVKRKKWVILDTETTGLRPPAEVIQVGIINADGTVLLDCLVKPAQPIPQEAINIHGITNEMAAEGLEWSFVAPLIRALINGKELIIYNAGYDCMILDSTDKAHGLDMCSWGEANAVHCAMLAYAEYYGDWDDYHGNNRWQRLTSAVSQMGLKESAAHSAVGDCKMTLAVILEMAKRSGIINRIEGAR